MLVETHGSLCVFNLTMVSHYHHSVLLLHLQNYALQSECPPLKHCSLKSEVLNVDPENVSFKLGGSIKEPVYIFFFPEGVEGILRSISDHVWGTLEAKDLEHK